MGMCVLSAALVGLSPKVAALVALWHCAQLVVVDGALACMAVNVGIVV